MIGCKNRHALVKLCVLMVLNERGADAQSFLV
jgi:hypothetical protein